MGHSSRPRQHTSACCFLGKLFQVTAEEVFQVSGLFGRTAAFFSVYFMAEVLANIEE